ncbi:hypothetical protein HNR36_000584 [Ureibacillus thermosphaericus]|uniref:Uncharacterized protein n=1 Tax=Ureibacillus thermosphaericus TaxID=51173 RepID=A0A840PNY2_URETH|nr:hypothetical protein [Ureibacillus thermosphaericus]
MSDLLNILVLLILGWGFAILIGAEWQYMKERKRR